MGYSIQLSCAGLDDEPIFVPQYTFVCYGSNIMIGDNRKMIEADMNMTYNYSKYFYKFGFDVRDICRDTEHPERIIPVKTCIPMIISAMNKCMNDTEILEYSNDYWEAGKNCILDAYKTFLFWCIYHQNNEKIHFRCYCY